MLVKLVTIDGVERVAIVLSTIEAVALQRAIGCIEPAPNGVLIHQHTHELYMLLRSLHLIDIHPEFHPEKLIRLRNPQWEIKKA